jgi:hypothetical protein
MDEKFKEFRHTRVGFLVEWKLALTLGHCAKVALNEDDSGCFLRKGQE